ncbi:MAG: ribonucleoside-triphosphate reductase, adenosylcobalamin-dependent [Nostocales cyanobacterium]|nr:MAG: ribonucleoside-triphosphate reductase, adenosylcobalamin-dependent [Nostocales cyanobacterium]
MVQELERKRQSASFPETAPAANPVFFRTYSRRTEAGLRESYDQVCDRTLKGLVELGKLTPEEAALLDKMQRNMKSLPSGRWMWVGGTDWLTKPKNFSGAYNCTSTNLVDWKAFGLMMDLAMMGCGTGAIIEPQYINQLPSIRNPLNITITGEIGSTPPEQRREFTQTHIEANTATIHVGDSREGWVKSYQTLLELSSDERFTGDVEVIVDISDVRQSGETLKGFGGMANPVKLPGLYQRCASILNKAIGRQLNSVECCLLIDEAAVTIVAGNIRRCIAYGARVSAIDGMKPIQDIQLGDLVLTSSGEYRPVVNKFIQGVQDVVEIRTSITSIRCTANHRVAVYDGLRSYKWKYAGELQPGDRLISVPHLQGQPCSTTDWAWLVGFFIGDGHADLESTKRRNGGGGVVSFAISTERLQGQLGQKILRILSSLGYSPALKIQGNSANINIYRKNFAEELGQYKQPWGCPLIPEFVWRGNREIRAAFLAGLSDADGTPSRNVLVNSNKLEFLREIQKLALSLGIATTLQERKPRAIQGRDKIYDGCHALHIKGLQSQAVVVGLINQFAIRDGFTIRLAKKNGLTLPYQLVQELAATGWQPNTLCRANVLWVDPKGRPGKFRDANFDTLIAEDLVNPHWLPIEVQFVAPAGQAETFDIEVESDHEFIADGLLVHNSAGMRQFVSEDEQGATSKDNLWQQDAEGNWRIDPERDSLRMANHTRVFHRKPTLEESIAAVRKQYYSGEGAIQWAGEAVARANIDLLNTPELKKYFLQAYEQGKAEQWIKKYYPEIDADELEHRIGRFGLNPCGEIIGSNFHCNLSEVHLNQLDPDNYKEQEEAFTAGALSVAALLNHHFQEPRYQYSRELDPIVGVSFTGLFDFFVHAFGVDWLRWWEQGRPETPEGLIFKRGEQKYLSRWREIVHKAVWEYCDRHHIKRPNRCTTVQPSGTKSLLTGASSGWHPPKAQRFIRRITFRKNDPVALACIDYGYNVIPSQSDKDENGNLLNDPFDPRCTEWLVEIPVAVSWADLPGADVIDVSKFSVLAQLDFVMQVQKYYTSHNTSATLELRSEEVEPLGTRIYEAIQNDEGYISAALLARFDDIQTFPRLPFEPIDKATYERLSQEVKTRRKTDDFCGALSRYDLGELTEAGPSGCDSDKCMLPEQAPTS